MSLGTPAYMAPEQALGDPGADHRADLYAWGLVAWELLTGAHPFAGRTTLQAMVSAQISEPPPPVGSRRTDVPAPLAALVMRALEKDPARRPQSAREVLSALDALATPSAGEPGSASSRVTGSRPVPRRWSRGLLAVTLLAATVGSAIVFRARSAARGADAGSAATVASPADALTSLAVLPFVNTSGDAKDEYFSDGMTDELAHALSKLPGLRLAGRSSSFAFKGRTVPALDVGKTLGVGAIIEGTVRRSGDRLRVTAQLTSTRDGRVIWSDGFEREGTDVFAVQDAFTSAIVGALTPMLGGALTTSTASAVTGADTRGTADAQAYDLYLRGRYFWAQRGAGPLDTAVALFSRAVQRDPRFARGWAGLAVAHVMRPNFNALVPALSAFDSAEAAARRALAIDSSVADAHAAIGMSYLRRFDLQAAGDAFAMARRLEAQNATVHHWSALYFGVLGDTAQADREIDAAVSLDPVSATTLNSRATALSDRRRFAEALETFARVTALSGKFSSVFSNSNRALIWTGRADSTLRLQRVRMRETTLRGRFGGLLLAAAAAGQWDEARQMRATIQRGGDPSILVFDRAVAELVFGDRTRAADLFVQSLETEGTLANVMFSLCDPILDPIRDERVFVTFRERHGLRDCPYRSPWPIGTPPAEGR
jgi:serine/threonine-protein kinase